MLFQLEGLNPSSCLSLPQDSTHRRRGGLQSGISRLVGTTFGEPHGCIAWVQWWYAVTGLPQWRGHIQCWQPFENICVADQYCGTWMSYSCLHN